MITIEFRYLTGLLRPMFTAAALTGSWSGWQDEPMTARTGDDGCPSFVGRVTFDDARAGETVRWGVRLAGVEPGWAWGIGTERPEPGSTERVRELVLPAAGTGAVESYHLSWGRRLGAQKHVLAPGVVGSRPILRFSVWAPHALMVDVVFATAARPYIDDRGGGIDPARPVVPLTRGEDGIWWGSPPGSFAEHVGAPYMYRVTTAEGAVVYRTDLASRWQAGQGSVNPAESPWDGDPATLEGNVSCSVVIDLDVVRSGFDPGSPVVTDEEFWSTEFTPGRPVPARLEDLVIYELHVGALGYPDPVPGTLADALALLDQLADLGVTAVELMPLAEFAGSFTWGYGNTHHFAIESGAGGRDEYKHFVRACHRRGIAVIQDVVYNHFDQHAARAQWQYDSAAPDRNGYYWYEGSPADYPFPEGGYVDNGSSGWAPRYHEEAVRQLFVSSAVQLMAEFHVDGLRVDLTGGIHGDNRLHLDGRPVPRANLYGQKLLREWSATLSLVRPGAFLIAEDHSGWEAVTRPLEAGGLGFGARWYAEFYHHLIGDWDRAAGSARLLHEAGSGGDGPLPMAEFADRLGRTRQACVVYAESHDEAGNSEGTGRSVTVAVRGAPLVGLTRQYAEARTRVVNGLSLLSAGTPMFFMGEEVAAQKPYRYDNVAAAKEDLHGERAGSGAGMFRFFQDLIALRAATGSIRSRSLDVVHAWDDTRVIAFTRGDDTLVVASLGNRPYLDGYVLSTSPGRLPDGGWREVLNSDSRLYGGSDVGNAGAVLPVAGGRIELRLPANGLVVLRRV